MFANNIYGAQQVAKAWVTFNGLNGSINITSSYNVSSVVWNATGDYTIGFTNPLSSSNYVVCGSTQQTNSTVTNHSATININGATPPTNSSCRINTAQKDLGNIDCYIVTLVIFAA